MSTQVTCPHCGASNVEGAGFCESCGKAMPSTTRSGPRVLTGDAVPTSGVGHAMVSDQLHKEMRKASWALLAVAILQTIVGPIMLVAAASNGGQQVAIPAMSWVIILGIAAAFWVLFIWSRFAPLPAAIVGLALFVTIHLLDAILDPMTIVQGLIMKIIVIFVLVKAISAALKYKKLSESSGVSPV